MNEKEFGNARFSRNLYERTLGKAAVRCSISGEKLKELTVEDFSKAIADGEFSEAAKNRKSLGFL